MKFSKKIKNKIFCHNEMHPNYKQNDRLKVEFTNAYYLMIPRNILNLSFIIKRSIKNYQILTSAIYAPHYLVG